MGSEVIQFTLTETAFIGVITCVIAAAGLFVNISVIRLLIRTLAFRNAFFYICVCHLISNCVELSLNLFWTGPATFLNLNNSITNSFIGSRIAQISLVFWVTSIYSQLQIAINRLIAIAFPMLYSRIFVGRKLLYFMSLFWVLTLCHAALFSWEACSAYYDAEMFSWMFRPTTCGYIAMFYSISLHGMCTSILIFSLDTTTFCCIRRKITLLRQTSGVKSKMELTLLKKNIRFYAQGCIQNTMLFITIISFVLISRFATTRLQVFVTTTLTWELLHSTNGIIVVLFNKPLREKFFKTKKLESFASSVKKVHASTIT